MPIRRFGLNFFRSYALNQLHRPLEGGQKPAQAVAMKIISIINRVRAEKLPYGESFSLPERLVSMIRELELYTDDALNFENAFIQASINYYEAESSALIASASLPEYLKYASDRLSYESETIASIIAPSSKDKLISTVQSTLINNRLDRLFPGPSGSSIRKLFAAEDLASLKILYDLINRVCAIDIMTREWSAFVKGYGNHLLESVNECSVIDQIVKFKDQIDVVLRDCFLGSSHLQAALQDAFESFMNIKGERMAELLVIYIHHHMLKKMNDDRIPVFMAACMALFRFLYRKESFDTFYKRALAQRLLFGVSVDLNLEAQFIAELGKNCGENFVMRMENMLKDRRASEDYYRSFRQQSNNPKLGAAAVSVISILWPQTLQSDVTFKIPSLFRDLEASFGAFYSQERKGAKLAWNRRMGSCVMNGYFGGSSVPKELVLTQAQACVLLQFNNNDSLSPAKLATLLEMSSDLLEETVASLSTAQYPVLLRQGGNIVYNSNFTCEARRVPLYLLQEPFLSVEDAMSPTEGLVSSTTSTPLLGSAQIQSSRPVSLIGDRQIQVDALLVRRMKQKNGEAVAAGGKRDWPRSDLVNYVLATLKDVPISAADVNGRIDDLIGKGYLAMTDPFSIVYVE